MTVSASDLSRGYVADLLGEWAAGLELNHIPIDALHEAKRCILDVVGVSIAGASHPTAALIRDRLDVQYGTGSITILGTERSTSIGGAAFANGVAAHVWDYDDVSLEGMVHATAAVFPAVLAIGQANNLNGADLLTAFVAGVEAEYALGRACTPDLFFRGWWTTGLLGAIGAAIGAGRAMGLGPPEMAQAVRIAASQTTGPYVLVGTPIKPYACGRAAEAGVNAASFAAAGLTGPDDAFENRHGFTAMFAADTFHPEEIAKLGERYVLNTSRLTFKQYPVCAGAQGSVAAVLKLTSENKLDAGEIEHLRCEVPPAIGHYMQHRVPENITEAQFSLPYCVACAMRFGDIGFEHLDEEAIRDAITLAHLDKVEVVLSEDLAAQEAANDDYIEPAIAIALTTDGRELRAMVKAPPGTPVQPLTDQQLEAKFEACLATVPVSDTAAGLIDRIWHFEEQPSVLALLNTKR
mgnify:CR=1 FL=1